jgi:hypothetical protein
MALESYIRHCFQRALTAFSHSKNEWENDPRKYFCLTEEEIQKVDQTFRNMKRFLDQYNFCHNQCFELLERAKHLELLLVEVTQKMNQFSALLVRMQPR